MVTSVSAMETVWLARQYGLGMVTSVSATETVWPMNGDNSEDSTAGEW